MRILTLFSILIMSVNAFAQNGSGPGKINTRFLAKILHSHPGIFDSILNHPGKNEVQILYTRIDRDKNNLPHFRSYSYNLNSEWYFYPASTVKLPVSIFALEKINELNIPGLSPTSAMITDSAYAAQTKVTKDLSSASGLPSVEHYIKKILLTSDNDAFNRLFEFVGRAEINRKLKANSALYSRILNRLAIGDGGERAKHTNPVSFYKEDQLVYMQPAQYDPKDYPLDLKNLLRGKAYLDGNDKLVNEPFNFADKNVYTIADQQSIMKKLMFPEAFQKSEQFNLKPHDYELIYKYMSMYPGESDYPKYEPIEFWPTYSKFLFYGRDKNAAIDPNIRIFNKYGDSYGYVIDNSYFVDFKNKVEFMLTTVVQSNEDGIYNDDKYEYLSICYPFLKNLGRVIYDHELKRKKRYLPDLEKFKDLHSGL